MKPFSEGIGGVQWAALFANMLLMVNFIVALVVPWVEAEMEIANAWVPIYIPVELGLVRCFSDICQVHKQKGHGHNQGPPGGWPGGGPTVSAGNSGVKMLFQVASVLTVLLLGFSLLLALAGTAIEYSRLTTRPETDMDFPLRMTASASLICLLAVLQYLFLTLFGLNGGHYEVGFWLTLGAGLLAAVLSFAQLLANKQADRDGIYGHDVFHPATIHTRPMYQQPQAGAPARGSASDKASLVAPVASSTYGSLA